VDNYGDDANNPLLQILFFGISAPRIGDPPSHRTGTLLAPLKAWSRPLRLQNLDSLVVVPRQCRCGAGRSVWYDFPVLFGPRLDNRERNTAGPAGSNLYPSPLYPARQDRKPRRPKSMVEFRKKDSPAGAGRVGVPSQGKEAPIGVCQPARGSREFAKKEAALSGRPCSPCRHAFRRLSRACRSTLGHRPSSYSKSGRDRDGGRDTGYHMHLAIVRVFDAARAPHCQIFTHRAVAACDRAAAPRRLTANGLPQYTGYAISLRIVPSES
jgi:hypothetical protein